MRKRDWYVCDREEQVVAAWVLFGRARQVFPKDTDVGTLDWVYNYL